MVFYDAKNIVVCGQLLVLTINSTCRVHVPLWRKIVVLTVSTCIHVVVGSNLGEQTFFFFLFSFFPIDLKPISFTEMYESVVIFKFPRRLYFYVFNIYNAGLLNTKS